MTCSKGVAAVADATAARDGFASSDGASAARFARAPHGRSTAHDGARPSRPALHLRPAGPDKAVETVLRAFDTWAFKREQPSDPQLLHHVVANAVARGEPLRFVLYWGKGPRTAVASPDRECLDFLSSMAARVKAAHAPGATLTLILTDTHARLNGHPEAGIDAYFGDVTAAAAAHGFVTRRLAEITDAAGPPVEPDPDETVPEEIRQNLTACAAKWYRGEGRAEDGALEYFRTNMVEKRAVEIAFPGAIFVTFNGSKMRSLFPRRLPIVYMYSLRRGVGVKPWFITDETTSGGRSDDASGFAEAAE